MGSAQTIAATSIAAQAMQMEHPSPEAIWSRAVESFDGEELAREWMNNPLPILDHHTHSSMIPAMPGSSARS